MSNFFLKNWAYPKNFCHTTPQFDLFFFFVKVQILGGSESDRRVLALANTCLILPSEWAWWPELFLECTSSKWACKCSILLMSCWHSGQIKPSIIMLDCCSEEAEAMVLSGVLFFFCRRTKLDFENHSKFDRIF